MYWTGHVEKSPISEATTISVIILNIEALKTDYGKSQSLKFATSKQSELVWQYFVGPSVNVVFVLSEVMSKL